MHSTEGNEMTITVLGGTGKTGRRVAERLRARGVTVRAASRGGDPRFDWEDRDTWAPALRGASAAYVTFQPDLAAPGAPEAIAALGEVARRQGTSRLVLLSGRGEAQAERAERALAESRAEWTVVRCSWFNQNFSESFFLEPLLGGELALPADGVAEPFVDADDVADVAVAALTDEGHAGQVYELTGPRLLRFDEAVGEIAAATGRDLRYVPVPVDAYAAALAAENVPGELIEMLRLLFTEVLDGRNSVLADGVQRALGRPPRDFAEFARGAARTGVWDPP
jgi:uncharacterized protein YbjT (DUF2867 family)